MQKLGEVVRCKRSFLPVLTTWLLANVPERYRIVPTFRHAWTQNVLYAEFARIQYLVTSYNHTKILKYNFVTFVFLVNMGGLISIYLLSFSLSMFAESSINLNNIILVRRAILLVVYLY